jgi:hypothetical protein
LRRNDANAGFKRAAVFDGHDGLRSVAGAVAVSYLAISS